MIQRTALPNLAKQNKKQEQNALDFSMYKRRRQYMATSQSQDHNYSSGKKRQSSVQHISSSNNRIATKQIPEYLRTEQSLQSQYKTLQMKMVENPEIFHTKLKKFREKQQHNKTVAPYFSLIHNSLKILQNSEDLKRKMELAKIQQTERIRRHQTQNSKKKLSKKLTHRSSNKIQPCIENSQQTDRFSTINDSKIDSRRQKLNTQPSKVESLGSTLKNRKVQLTEDAKQGKYTFKHFNSGEIFAEIAQINQDKILMNSNHTNYRITDYGTFVNNVSSLRSNNKVNAKKQLDESFRDEYNTFLKNILPSSFGENGNKSCIYEEYVIKRKNEERQKVKSKLVEGNYLRTQPAPLQKYDFIFSNEIAALSAKKLEMERMFDEKITRKQDKFISQKVPVNLKKDFSASSSKVVTKTNTKLNTLRQGQSLQSKLKLKKLARLEEKQKEKILKKQRRSNQNSRNQKSSLSNYHNNISETEMSQLFEKSNYILGKELTAQSQEAGVVNKQWDVQINQFEAKHLYNVDKLLGQWETQLRKEKDDNDSVPWKISVKLEKKKAT